MSLQSSCLCKICRNELADVCTRGCEGSIEFMRKMTVELIVTYLDIQINCTAPLETSGAIVRYRIRC